MSKQSIPALFDDLRSEIYTLSELMQDVQGVCGHIPIGDYDRHERLSLYYDYMHKEIGRMLGFVEYILDCAFSLESLVNQNLDILPIGVEEQRQTALEECRKIEREADIKATPRNSEYTDKLLSEKDKPVPKENTHN